MSSIKIDPSLHLEKKPDWIKVRLPSNPVFFSTKDLISDLRLHTVCESAKCPNHWECWSKGTATFMILGDVCTRACGLCAVQHGRPAGLDAEEPARVAEAVVFVIGAGVTHHALHDRLALAREATCTRRTSSSSGC